MTLYRPVQLARLIRSAGSRAAVALATVLLAAVVGSAGAVEPGTEIVNRAEIRWFDTGTGTFQRTLSNRSSVRVASVPEFAIDPEREIATHPGQYANVAYRIDNTGNVPDRYRVSAVDVDGDAGTLRGLDVYLDVNGNGIVDAGEPRVGETVTVAPGGVVELVIAGSVPGEALEGERYALALRATSEADGTERVSRTALVVTDGAFILLRKSSDLSCAVGIEPGEDIDYRIDFTSSGNRTPEARDHDVDGEAVAGVLIVDELPAGTGLATGQAFAVAPPRAVPLVQLEGAVDAWTRYDGWDGEGEPVRLGLLVPADALRPGLTGRFGFTLRADDRVPTDRSIDNVAAIDLDGDGVDDFRSNSVCNRFATPPVDLGAAISASLRFVEPSQAVREAGRVPDFADPTEFVDSGGYRLDRDDGRYEVVRDGAYLELTAEGLTPVEFTDGDGRPGAYLVAELRSIGTGDTLQVVMLETGPDAGVYRALHPIALIDGRPDADALAARRRGDRANGRFCPGGDAPPAVPVADLGRGDPDCLLSSLPNDTLQVSFAEAGLNVTLTDTVSIEPTATVFDAFNLDPVPGATVTVYEGPGGTGAVATDRFTGEPAVEVTDERGQYVVPLLEPGTGYAVVVEPPEGHLFPSFVPPENFPTYDVNAFSYGAEGLNGPGSGLFAAMPGVEGPIADIPLDPSDRFTRLSIEKRALRTEAGPGELVGYAVRVQNTSDEVQYDAVVDDALPYGFKLVDGTATIDGERTDDTAEPGTPGTVAGAPGPDLRFSLGRLEPGEERELGYVLEVTAGAIDGDGLNVAEARARTGTGAPLQSPTSRARVRLERTGVLSDRASLFGKVYIDADCNALQNDAEWPIGGVKLYLDDGTFAITDENGQYSLYGLEPGAHALRVDPITMPEGLEFKPIDIANAAVGDSRFVDLSSGDFHRADFAASCPDEADLDEVFAEIRERNERIDGTWLLDEAGEYDPDVELDPLRATPRDADIDGDLSNGILNGPDAGRTRSERRLEDEALAERENREALAPEVEPDDTDAIDPKALAGTITAEQGKAGTWLWPDNDTSLDGRFVTVVRAGVEPTLFVNGQPVDAAQIGERIENRREGAQIVAWYGVTLRAGVNRVEVRGTDPFGNTRILAKGEFKRPSMGTRMVLRARSDTLPADGGRTVLPIEINILDDNDFAAQGVSFVTLEADGTDGASWLEEDLQDAEPGHQVRVQDGRATVHLKSSEFTGTVNVRASTGDMGARLRVYQVASLRPLFAVGLLEVDYGASRVDADGRGPTAQADDLDGDDEADARLSMFLKGKVRGDAQLTLSYDTEKDSDAELLRDINPNAHYPVHGDASVRGYEAQSRSKLYAKLERGKNSVMWGDYLTDSDADTVADLAASQRVLTGLNARYDNGRTRVQAFAARPEDGRGVEELRGNGTAMLFALEGAPIVANSEVVELIVRDRTNPGLVVSVQRLSRFGDYLLDPIAGQLTFSRPIPSFDEELNPVFVRVSYDLDSGGEEHTVAGVRVRHAITDALVVGASFTDDANPETGGTLGGAYAEYRPSESFAATIGVARFVHDDGSPSGNAQRIGIERSGGRVGREHLTELVLARAEEGFASSGAAIAAGRQEASLTHTRRLTDTLGVTAEATHSEAMTSDELRSTLGFTIDRVLGAWTLRAGARHIRQRAGADDDSFNTALVGAERRFSLGGRTGSLYAEYEQDIGLASRNRVALGGKLQVHEHAHLYARYERQNGIYDFAGFGGQSDTQTLAAGVESDVLPNTRLYSEYRMRGGIGGRDLETGSGVRGNYELQPGLTVSPALEVVDTIEGDDAGDGVAVSLGAVDTRNPNAKLSGRAEIRHGEASDYVGLRGTYAARVNLDWTALVRDSFTRQDPADGEVTMRHSFTAGLARRPRLDNRHHMLFQYQFKQERTAVEAGDRDVHVLSTHQNLQLGPKVTLSGRLGGKRETTFLDGIDFDGAAYLVDARVQWDIDRRWGLDLQGGMLMTGRDGRSRRYSAGAGMSYVMDRNLQLRLGYNVAGFRDEDLDPEGYDARGVRIGLRYKFDDSAFRWLQGE